MIEMISDAGTYVVLMTPILVYGSAVLVVTLNVVEGITKLLE